MSEFRADRAAGKLPVANAKLYPGLTMSDTIKASDKSRLFVDLDGEVVVGYFPNYVGKITQSILTRVLGDLVRVCPPRVDRQKGDRRARKDSERCDDQSPTSETEDEDGIENQAEDEEDWVDVDEESDPDLQEDFAVLGNDDWCSDDVIAELQAELQGLATDEQESPLYARSLRPSSYYHAAGWYATGQEYKHPMKLSSQFRAAFKRICRAAMLRFLNARRELDSWIAHLVCILHWSLAKALKALRQRMRALGGDVGAAVTRSWSSLFPCTAVGFNRTTRRHRDSKGFRYGLDAICVLGAFNNGPLVFPELGLKFEWQPGCLGLFDGYDLVHEVEEWEGLFRLTLISFCRGSSWRGLKEPLDVEPPTLESVEARLQESIEDARSAGRDVQSRQTTRSRNSVD
ncbi:hypothetical protein FS749_003134 [Ceratobasidium sp. UAMH 11750]|nr:hypothetical protein FS749_003134 [Ceratobasidium sp. UAMH 11750]